MATSPDSVTYQQSIAEVLNDLVFPPWQSTYRPANEPGLAGYAEDTQVFEFYDAAAGAWRHPAWLEGADFTGAVSFTGGITGNVTFGGTVALNGATSTLTVGNNTTTTTPLGIINGAAATTRRVLWQSAGVSRFSWGADTVAETATIIRATNAASDPAAPSIALTTNAATTSGNILTFASTTGVVAGQTVVGTNITSGTRVTLVTSTQVFLDADVTGGGVANGATVRFGANRLPFASVASLSVGMAVQGGGMAAGTRITHINGTDVYLSNNLPSSFASGTSITFSALTGGNPTVALFTDQGGSYTTPLQIFRNRPGVSANGAYTVGGVFFANGVQQAGFATAMWSNTTVKGIFSGSAAINLIQATDYATNATVDSYRSLFNVTYAPGAGSSGASAAIDARIVFSERTAAREGGDIIDAFAIRGTGTFAVNQGGTGLVTKGGSATAYGDVRGALFVASAQGTATNLHSITGIEVNLNISGTATCALENGVTITKIGSTDARDAAVMSSHIQLTNGGTPGVGTMTGFKSGIGLSNSPPGHWGFDADSVIIDGWRIGNGPVGNVRWAAAGIDFQSVTFARDVIRAPGAFGPWRVNQNGDMQVGTTMFVKSAAGLTITAKGAYATAVGVSVGGSGYTANDYLYFGNGGIAYVDTVDGSGAITAVTVLRYPYVEDAGTAPATYACTMGWNSIGTGAVLSMTWNTTGTGVILAASGQKIGFYGTAAIVKPTVTGSKGANAALTSLMTALANLGLVVDSTS